MREIKFRGKLMDNGEWVYGLLLTNKLGTYIITETNPHECTQYGYIEISQYGRVDPETVGQYTNYYGLEFFDGDFITVACDCDSEYGCSHRDVICEVVWDENTVGYALKENGKLISLDNYGVENMHVVGNIYEHKHLINNEI